MTYNVWYDNPQNEENPWAERKSEVLETIQRIKPDVFCVQEALDHQVNDLTFESFRYFGVGRDDGNKGGEYAAIFYDTLRFDLIESGNFWLSENPDSIGSLGWDAACIRIATWVNLSARNSEKGFLVFNVHFDHVGEQARLESAKLIKSKMIEFTDNNPVILLGDFNFKSDSEPYAVITDHQRNLQMKDARMLNENNANLPEYTYVGYQFTGMPGNIIDHIFLSDGIDLLNYNIIENRKNNKCPSDHLPVVVDFKFSVY